MDGIINFKDIQREKHKKEIEDQLKDAGYDVSVYEIDLGKDDAMEEIAAMLKVMMSIMCDPCGDMDVYFKDNKFVIVDENGKEVEIDDDDLDVELDSMKDDEEEYEPDEVDMLLADLLSLNPSKITLHCADRIDKDTITILKLIFGAEKVVIAKE